MLRADTGMRRAELAVLALDDVDLRTRVAFVVGKGRRPRTVPFGARTAQALDRYMRARRLNPLSELRALWLAEKGRGVLTPDGIRQMLERRGKDIGVRVHAHMFRHGFADAWLRTGGSPNPRCASLTTPPGPCDGAACRGPAAAPSLTRRRLRTHRDRSVRPQHTLSAAEAEGRSRSVRGPRSAVRWAAGR